MEWLQALWDSLLDENHRARLFGVITILGGAVWAAYVHFSKKKNANTTQAIAHDGSIATGGNITVGRDLHINQGLNNSDVTTPESPANTNLERDVWLLDAIFYVAEKRWNSPNMITHNNDQLDNPSFMEKVVPAQLEVLQKACDGDLRIWGKEPIKMEGHM